jgi:hypothetical protein
MTGIDKHQTGTSCECSLDYTKNTNHFRKNIKIWLMVNSLAAYLINGAVPDLFKSISNSIVKCQSY